MARQRNFAQEYARRKARLAERGETVYSQRVERGARRGLNRSQAAGHAAAGDRRSASKLGTEHAMPVPFIDGDGGGTVEQLDITQLEAKRVGRWWALADRLAKGEVTPADFRRRVRRWRPVQGRQLVSDPDVALALQATTGPDVWAEMRYGRQMSDILAAETVDDVLDPSGADEGKAA